MDESQTYEALLHGLETVFEIEEFQKRAKEIITNASSRIIQDTKSKKITWIRDLGRYNPREDYFTAKVIVKNGRGEEIQLPATIAYRPKYTDAGYLDKHVELLLGDNGSISLASDLVNSSFKEVAENIFNLPPKEK